MFEIWHTEDTLELLHFHTILTGEECGRKERTENNCLLKQPGENETKNISEAFAGQEDLMQMLTAGYAFELKAGKIGVYLIGNWLAWKIYVGKG